MITQRKRRMTNNEKFPETILRLLVNTSREDIKKILKNTDEGKIGTRGKIPAFFYRHPLYYISASSARGGLSVSEQHHLSTSVKLDPIHAYMLEFFLLQSELKNGELSCSVPQSLFLMEYRKWQQGKMGNRYREDVLLDYGNFLTDLSNARLLIKENEHSFKSFSLLSEYSFDAKTGIIHISFSMEVIFLYMVDYLVSMNHYREVIYSLGSVASMMLRFLSSFPSALSMGITPTGFLEKGFPWDGSLWTEAKQDFIKQRMPLAKIGIGMRADGRGVAFMKDLYKKPTAPLIYADDISDMKRTGISIGSSTTESKNIESKYIVFSTLELSDILIKKAISLGVDSEEVEELFTLFKNTFSEIDKKYAVSGLTRTWSSFIKREKGDSIDSTSKENTGSSKNIVFNETMKKIGEEEGLSGTDLTDEFVLFTNHYQDNSKNITRSSWEKTWQSWAIRSRRYNKKTEAKGKTWETKAHIENQFYLMRLVSEGIKKMLSSKGVSALDVVKGVVVVNDVSYRTYPLPPSMGKGDETIFSFRDASLQEEAMNNYAGTAKSKKDTYTDTQIEETA